MSGSRRSPVRISDAVAGLAIRPYGQPVGADGALGSAWLGEDLLLLSVSPTTGWIETAGRIDVCIHSGIQRPADSRLPHLVGQPVCGQRGRLIGGGRSA